VYIIIIIIIIIKLKQYAVGWMHRKKCSQKGRGSQETCFAAITFFHTKIIKYTGQLPMGPILLWPTQPKFSVGQPRA